MHAAPAVLSKLLHSVSEDAARIPLFEECHVFEVESAGAREPRPSGGRHEERERRVAKERAVREQDRERVPRARDAEYEQDHQWNSHARGLGGEHQRTRHAVSGGEVPREREDRYPEHDYQHQR